MAKYMYFSLAVVLVYITFGLGILAAFAIAKGAWLIVIACSFAGTLTFLGMLNASKKGSF